MFTAIFTHDPSLQPYAVSARTYLTTHDKHWDGLASGAIVFQPVPDTTSAVGGDNPPAKVLLIQRAAHDSMPLRWEVPGGAVDSDDPSILFGCARELFEEAGLRASHFSSLATEGGADGRLGYTFTNRTGSRVFHRFSFVVEVEKDGDDPQEAATVRLDPNEHEDWLWASEEDIRTGKVGDKEIPLTSKAQRDVLMEAFRIRASMNGGHGEMS